MSANALNLFVQEYNSNVQLLLQQRGSKLRDTVTIGSHTGEGASPVDQVGTVEMTPVVTRFGPMGRVDAPVSRRWVHPESFELPQLIDNFDKLRLAVALEGPYVQAAVAAAGRQIDKLILNAVLGTAKTGKTGTTSTIFTAANEVDVAFGGANSKLNVAKLREAKRLMMANFVDFDMETPTLVITAYDHDALLGDIQVTNKDYNDGTPVLKDGKVTSFMGFNFVHCELVETILAGTNEVTLPIYLKSGMHLGIWGDVSNAISQREDLSSRPWQLYTTLTAGATRIEENKVYAIESYRA